ncbi:serine carboxypeptidase S28-domain-containing protein [Coniochaeta sp. 2T2.1]|nr:serine carboxypeptidase S28-domain-containing protein [Coniochaeta sp. 2T2.1]
MQRQLKPHAGTARRTGYGRRRKRRSRGIKQHTHPSPDLISNGTFDQLLDHKDPGKGTFNQRYWWDATHYKGPGSPIFLFNVGEQPADKYVGYLEEGTISGKYAEVFEGAVIVVEHRYWGESIPFEELTTETLQYLDLPQSIHDMTYFARNVALDFDSTNGDANAPNSPWVLIGGSYPGALAAWTSVIDPGTFWAYHASSAVVEAIYDFHPYFDAVERAIPRNCSADLKAVVSYIDSTFAAGNEDDIHDLKAMFGLAQLDHADDFAERITIPLWSWQSDDDKVFDFCDYIETASYTGRKSRPKTGGVGLETALLGYAAWVNATSGKTCKKGDCSTYSKSTIWDDPSDLTTDRQWSWMLCHMPFAWWQVGPPANDKKHVVSSLLRPEHFQRQCGLMFPKTNGFEVGSVRGWTAEHLNMWTGGWNASFERVMFLQGEYDPWIEATVSSTHRPGGPLKSSDETPVFVVRNGNHVPDLVLDDIPEENSVLELELATMKRWLDEWTPPKASR